MPQQVLVPFVQTTVSGPIRLTETQESSLVGVTNTATTGAFVATGQIAAIPGAAGAANANAADAANAPGAAGIASNPQNLTDCLSQLKMYERRIAQLVAQTEALAAQVERLKGLPPIPPP